MKRGYVFAATGNVEGLMLKPEKDDFLIAADSGYYTARKLGMNVNMVIGDFDSLDGSGLPDEIKKKYPQKKNKTDTMIAIEECFSNGCDEIIIVGGTGGRTDHLYANIQLLKYINDCGKYGCVVDANEEIRYFSAISEAKIPSRIKYFSVFSYSPTATISIDNAEYPLENHTITNSFPLGISNEPDQSARVTVHEGEVIIFTIK